MNARPYRQRSPFVGEKYAFHPSVQFMAAWLSARHPTHWTQQDMEIAAVASIQAAAALTKALDEADNEAKAANESRYTKDRSMKPTDTPLTSP